MKKRDAEGIDIYSQQCDCCRKFTITSKKLKGNIFSHEMRVPSKNKKPSLNSYGNSTSTIVP